MYTNTYIYRDHCHIKLTHMDDLHECKGSDLLCSYYYMMLTKRKTKKMSFIHLFSFAYIFLRMHTFHYMRVHVYTSGRPEKAGRV